MSSTATAPSPRGYNTDEAAAKRAAAQYVIAGEVYRPRLKRYSVTRELRKLIREQETALRDSDRARREADRLDGTEVERIRADAAKRSDDAREALLARADALEAEVEAIAQHERDQQIARAADESDAASERLDMSAYRMIALLLEPDGGDEAFDREAFVDKLLDEIDVEDAGQLAQTLAGGGEVVEDPTTTPTT